MSRKREKTKEQKAELARQLGVKARELQAIGDTLRAQERVCSPTMKASLTVTKAGLGLLRRRGTLALHLALYLVDKSGVWLVRRQLRTGTAAKVPGPALLTPTTAADDEERIRYARPASSRRLTSACARRRQSTCGSNRLTSACSSHRSDRLASVSRRQLPDRRTRSSARIMGLRTARRARQRFSAPC